MKRSELLAAIIEDMARMRRAMVSLQPSTRTPKGLPTHAQVGILFFLGEKDKQTLKELSQGLWMTPSAATQLVDGLVQQQLILRVVDVRDRRKIRLSLTPRGRRKLLRAKMAYATAIRTLFDSLSSQELLQYHLLQQKLIRRHI